MNRVYSEGLLTDQAVHWMSSQRASFKVHFGEIHNSLKNVLSDLLFFLLESLHTSCTSFSKMLVKTNFKISKKNLISYLTQRRR